MYIARTHAQQMTLRCQTTFFSFTTFTKTKLEIELKFGKVFTQRYAHAMLSMCGTTV